MGKNVYSLVLSDQVIAELDKAAYRAHTSRSNLCNQILAEFLSMTTPEKRAKGILEQVVKLTEEYSRFQLHQQPSDAMLSLRSPLHFKYNPTIRYSVELTSAPDGAMARLRIDSRTQSSQLLELLDAFFYRFLEIEQGCLSRYIGNRQVSANVEAGRLERVFYFVSNEESLSVEEIGGAISQYIQMFDEAINAFFSHLDQPQLAGRKVKDAYLKYFENGAVIA